MGRGLQCLGAPSSVLHQLCSPLVPILVAGAHNAAVLELQLWAAKIWERARIGSKTNAIMFKERIVFCGYFQVV